MQSNPFKPTAGRTPPELIGRDDVINDFIDGINNGCGAPERLMRVTGMRGMGKTVMLNELGKITRDLGWTVVDETAEPGLCERIYNRLAPKTQVRSVNLGPNVLGVGLGSVEFERSSLSLREAMTTLLARTHHGLLITLDEVQDATIDEVRSLSIAVQHMIREGANIAFVFAGLPSLIKNVVNGETLTFLRRALPVDLGLVENDEVASSFNKTIHASGLTVSTDALQSLTNAARGYPFMIQLVGYHTWQTAYRARGEGAEIGIKDARHGIEKARSQFDRMVIEPALQRLPATSLSYLLAMAEDRGAPSHTGTVADRLGKDIRALSSYRERLLEANVIEARTRGTVEFAIPYMADYLLAHRGRLLADMG